MQAAVCYEYGQPLVVEEIDLDKPECGEVRVAVRAVAVCHSDVHMIREDWNGTLPAVAGHEAAGVVEAVGDDVASMKVGDHVIVSLLRSCGHCFYCQRGEPALCEGSFALLSETRLHTRAGEPISQGIRTAAFAEQVVVDQSQLVRVPADLPFDQACLLACGVITGCGAAVNTGQVRPGESVAVIGAGGVGLNAVQGASIAGAGTVIAVDVLNQKLEFAHAFGATHGVNAQDPNATERVRELTAGRGVDCAIIAVGSTDAVAQAIELTRRGGTVVIAGLPHADATVPLPVYRFGVAGKRILGSFMGSTRLAIDVPRLVGLYQQGRLKLDELISNRYSLSGINEAIAEMETGEVRRNVVVMD